jgi:hypothetical protein
MTTRLLDRPKRGEHFVQTYSEPGGLLSSLFKYVLQGLACGHGVVIIATPQIRTQLTQLESLERARADGQLILLDAEQTLALFMRNTSPNWPLFEQAITPILSRLENRYGQVRAFGEMVNVLWHQKNEAAAINLEQMWNRLLSGRSVSLFCAYRMDTLDPKLELVCREHTHLLPGQHDGLLVKELHAVCENQFGKPLASIMREISLGAKVQSEVPPPHRFIIWLRRNMPKSADEVVTELRKRMAVSGAADA